MEEILDNFENGSSQRKRHGCVSAWLIFMIIGNALTALSYFFMSEIIATSLPVQIPKPMLYLMGAIAILNVVFSVMLFQWKKLGFYGFVVTSLLAFAMNTYIGISPTQSLFGLLGLGLLYAILQIKENKISAWNHLE